MKLAVNNLMSNVNQNVIKIIVVQWKRKINKKSNNKKHHLEKLSFVKSVKLKYQLCFTKTNQFANNVC